MPLILLMTDPDKPLKLLVRPPDFTLLFAGGWANSLQGFTRPGSGWAQYWPMRPFRGTRPGTQLDLPPILSYTFFVDSPMMSRGVRAGLAERVTK